MGVKGLWRLLLPIGRRVSIEVLEGKILAIDASIWLTQFLKAMRDPDTGSVKPAAHLIGFFRRLAKLRFHGIRPVLVFDGATPIIKLREINQRRQRREQFAPNTAGAVQRLAKRLLIQEIKKAKLHKPASGGAFTPGFNLPEDEKGVANDFKSPSNHENGDDDDVVVEKVVAGLDGSSEEIARTLQEQEWQGGSGDSTPKVAGKKAPVESSEAIARALQEEEWQHEKLDGEHKTNDWDKPLSDSESVELGNEQSEDIIGGVRDQDGLALANLSSLPSHARKDAIETAKRQQRMRSRQEFMPVAGQPEEYSQVQVRNFLRSTRLNQSIVNMAKELAEKKNVNGEGIASDSTRRIIFEKFDKKTTDNRNRKLIERQRSEKESDSDEFEWEDVNESDTAKPGAISAKITSKRETVILDSSDDEQIEIGTSELLPNRTPTKGLMFLDSSDDESTDSIVNAAQTVPATGTSESAGNLMTDSAIPSRKDLSHVVVNDKNGSISSESAGGGGFFVASSPNHFEKVGDELDLTNIAKASNGGAVGGAFAHHNDDTLTAKHEWGGNSKRDGDVSEELSEDGFEWEDGEAEEPEKTLVEPNQPADHFETSGIGDFDEDDEPANDFMMKSESTKNYAALQAAEKTAANLTNWAGRAFRRAVALHEQEHSTSQPTKSLSATSTAFLKLAVPQTNHTIMIDDDNDEDDQKPPPKRADAIVEAEESRERKAHEVLLVDDESESDGGTSLLDLSKVGVSSPATKGTPSTETRRAGAVSQSATSVLDLLSQEEKLEDQRRRDERDMDGINDEMKAEIISLIRLFGIPYVESPAEAEAQCAALEELGLVDGIVTEDSDVFVFGGKTIYKNIFDDQKFVEVYRAEDAEKEMQLGRDEMVALAMLLGGDYTEGVRGVGIVNSMEILQAFPMNSGVKEGLQEYRKWLDGFDPSDAKGSSALESEGLSGLQKFHASHRSARSRWECPKHFPAENVLNAYLNPVVDKSSERFSWGIPDVDKLATFCARNMGWEASDARRMLDPVMKRLGSGLKQTRLDTFMDYSDNIQFASVRSKRLRSVFKGIQTETPTNAIGDSSAPSSAKKTRNGG